MQKLVLLKQLLVEVNEVYSELLKIFSNLCIFRDAEIMRQKQEKKAEAAQGEVKK